MAKARSTVRPLARASPESSKRVVVFSCMELQLSDDVTRELERNNLAGGYDHLTLAGASLGAVSSRFPHWGRTFYEHLALSRALHGISRVVVVDHRGCATYQELLRLDLHQDPDREREVHLAHQQKLRRKIHALDPTLDVDCWLLGSHGEIENLSAVPDLWLAGITERRRKPRAKRKGRHARKKVAGRARSRR